LGNTSSDSKVRITSSSTIRKTAETEEEENGGKKPTVGGKTKPRDGGEKKMPVILRGARGRKNFLPGSEKKEGQGEEERLRRANMNSNFGLFS